MHIVLIDEDYQERRFVEEGLGKAFSQPTISIFTNVGVFLEEYEGLPKPFVLVLELILPLFAVEGGDDELIRRTKKLRSRFPWLGEDWDGQRGGEVLIRGIRSIQGGLPIIVNTDINREEISEDIIRMPGLQICKKDIEIDLLVQAIRSSGIA